MRLARAAGFGILLLLVASVAIAEKKPKKPDLPPVFGTAHTVYVMSARGDIFKPGLSPDDRESILDVQEAIKKWGRYTLATQIDKADLIVVVRKATPANDPVIDMGQGKSTGSMPTGMASQKPNLTPDSPFAAVDEMWVCQMQPNGKLGKPIWSWSVEDGLSGSRPLLVQQLRSLVDHEYPNVPAPAESAKP